MKADKVDGLFATAALAGLGPEARAGVWSVPETLGSVDKACSEGIPTGKPLECLRALVLLWHDHLDEAHTLVQDLSGADAAWVHGIMHRREPDYSNARYWFHRVGQHEAFESLAEMAAPLLAEHAALPFRLIRDGRWDPFAFIDAVSAAVRHPGESDTGRLLQELQRLEAVALARHLAAP